jgi:hypothetical protein
MRKMRLAKVRITPPAVGGSGPRMDGLDHLALIHRREAAEHDRNVRDYSPATVAAAWDDLAGREAWDRKNPEHRWVLERRAALRRLGAAMRERGEA